MYQHEKIPGRRLRFGVLALAALTLSGCSWTPDWANPVEWYRGTRDWVAGDDSKVQDARAQDAARQKKQGSAGQTPNLASVPDRPKDIADTSQVGAVQSGLVADRAQARYTAISPGDNRPGSVPPPVIASPPAPPSRAGSAAAAVDMPVPPPPPALPSVMAPPAMPEMQQPAIVSDSGTETMRSAFEAALNQSGGVVRSAPASGGIRDINRSNVVSSSGRNAMPLPPPPRGTIGLRPPPMSNAQVATVGGGSAGGSPAGMVLFDNNSSKLSAEDNKILENIVGMRGSRTGTVRVVGHASSRTRDVDPLNHRLVNFRLSLARANAVANALVGMGIPAKDIVVEAHADNEPLYHEFMPAGEAGNRRTEIYLDY